MQSQEFRLNPDSMRRIYVRPSSGEMVPLSAIVDVMVIAAPQAIEQFDHP